MRNILSAYVFRSPTIGYCQGMNFLTARLLTCLSEEEAFWVLIQMIEENLPCDYFCNLIGVLIDQKVLEHLIEHYLPKLQALLEEYPDLNMILQQRLFKWLMVLFVGELPLETEYLIWDMFMIKGSVVIFRVALSILTMM